MDPLVANFIDVGGVEVKMVIIGILAFFSRLVWQRGRKEVFGCVGVGTAQIVRFN